MKPKYSLIVPVYNEEAVILETHKRVTEVFEKLDGSYEILYVNDGSRDRSLELLRGIVKTDKNVRVLNFSRNFGHQPAVSAGMDAAQGDAVIIIDADLQDPPEVILQMVEKWKEGFDVVYGKRLKRKGETFFKKFTAKMFYRTLNSLTDVDMPVDTGDFRLIDRKVCEVFKNLTERNRYIRGLVSWAGFKQTAVEYVREERFAGETKYPLSKMLKLAKDGITSFSLKPLKLAMYLGFLISALSFIYLIVVLFLKIFGATVSGWASSMSVMLFFDGVILIILGILGEYVGRIYDEAKNRPLYILQEKLGYEDEKDTDER